MLLVLLLSIVFVFIASIVTASGASVNTFAAIAFVRSKLFSEKYHDGSKY